MEVKLLIILQESQKLLQKIQKRMNSKYLKMYITKTKTKSYWQLKIEETKIFDELRLKEENWRKKIIII